MSKNIWKVLQEYDIKLKQEQYEMLEQETSSENVLEVLEYLKKELGISTKNIEK